MEKGKLYLIPTSLSGMPLVDVYPENILTIIREIKTFVVETPKIGRSFLKGLYKDVKIFDLKFYTLNENIRQISPIIYDLKSGHDIGVISDAGAPGIGDMGTDLVFEAQRNEINVIPIVGPSAIMLAIMASGLSGQSFAFNGYLPKEQEARVKKIKQLEEASHKLNQAQVFIETPYRAQYVYEDIIKSCKDNTYLSLSVDLTDEKGFSKTKRAGEWKKENVDISKRQVVFIIQK
ncbi:MAG: Tetrapyrrole methylase family protein [candidate division WS6 bacterium GW2011_GWF2_39_15]|uniref:Tetrapyrrole methylase family protein n=1 Tax=candidate division WS6 bacterium GW2011_GWF2_39_15 TaxID=1619100 RepID=A0A0G0QWV2_9BACT|nr:MAG: Tetrapyrrole methylase family protein [candidate division WS6 bacterium GW2011_GWF2_39_15]